MHRIILPALAALILLPAQTLCAATRTWDGGGDGQTWQNATNWSGDTLPATGDDVIINVAGTNATIVYSGSDLTLRSLQCEETFSLAAGDVTVTNVSWANGGLTIAARRTLSVVGAAASFTAGGTINVTGASLSARNGGSLSLPTLGSYQDSNVCCGALLEANGAGSSLNLSGLTNLTGDVSWQMTIRALAGGSVNLSNVVQLGDGHVYALADGSNSVIHLEGLTSYTNSRILNLEARNLGVIQTPNLVDAYGVSLTIGTTGDSPTSQIRRLLELSLTGQNRTLAQLTNLDGGSLHVFSGASLSLPAVQSYADSRPACCGALWEASGANATLHFPALTNFAGSPTWTSTLRALGGGKVLLGAIAQISDGNLSLLADGVNSSIVLSNLVSCPGPTRIISLEARNSGVIQTPLLADGHYATFTIRSGGSLNVTQLTRARGFVADGLALTLPVLTNLDNANLSAINGGSLTFPVLPSYVDNGGCCGTLWEANGPGTFLNFPALTSLAGSFTWTPTIRGLGGGKVLLGTVTNIPDSNLNFLADGTNSLIVLTNLATYSGPSRLLNFEARNAGIIQTPLLTDGYFATFTVKSGGELDLNQLARFRGITVQNAVMTLPALTNMDGANISVSSGSLTLPSVTTFADSAGCCGVLWEANGPGTLLSLPALTTFTGPTWTPTIRALAGGTVWLPSLIQFPESHIYVLADGTNSRVVLSNLTAYASVNHTGAFEARNAGVIELTPGPFAATRGILTVQSAGQIQLGSLALYAGSLLQGNAALNADVFNYAGSVGPGTSPGILTLNSNYVQSGGTLVAEIGGTNAGSQYDRVIVNGAASLDGTLQIIRTGGFVPELTNGFTLLTAANVSGSFSNFVGLDAGSSREFLPSVSASNVTLTVAFSSGPKIIALAPTNSVTNSISSFILTFNEPVSADSFASADVALIGPAGAISITGVETLSATNYSVSFPPQITAGNYTLTVGPNINDLAGNAMNQDGDAANGEAGQDAFQTTLALFDSAPPTIASVSPSGPVNVNVAALVITFNEPVQAASFTTPDLNLSGPGGAIGLNSLTQSNATTWIAAFPTQTAAGTYAFTIGPNVLDLQGNTMTAAYGGSFVIDRSGPSVAGVTPSGSVTQAVSSVDLTFNEPLSLATFTAVDVNLTGPIGVIPATGVSSLGGNVYRVAFNQQATAGTYTMIVGPSLTDVAGNLMNQDGDGTPGEATQDRYTNSFTIFSPDLVAMNVNGPTNALPGQLIALSWTVTNAGNAAVSRTISEEVFLSSDAAISNDFRIASFELTNSLPPGASLFRTQSVTIPVNGPAGTLRLVVETDSNNEVTEANELNNFAIATAALSVPLALTFDLDAGVVNEGGTLSGVVSRNGPATTALTVNLTSTDPSELVAPPTVSIAAGQTEAAFVLTAPNDSVADGPQTATLTAAAAAFLSASNAVVVTDADIPNLSLVVSNAVIVEGQTGDASVTRQGDLDKPLVITLGSSSPGQVDLPANVTIPAGQASAAFVISAIDDPYVEAARGYSLTATATNYNPAGGAITVLDKDTPTLFLALSDAQVREGAGPGAATLTIMRVEDGVIPVTVQITASVPSALSFPATVTFQPGELAKLVSLSPLDDAVVETNVPLALTVQALETLSLNPLTPGVSTNLLILDDDGPSLRLAFSRDWVCTSAGTSSPLAQVTATLSRAGGSDAMNVSLGADFSGFLNFPTSIALPAGIQATNLIITTGTNLPTPPGAVLTLTASASGYVSAVGTLQSLTTCGPDLVIQNLSVPTNGLTDAYFAVNYRETNVGATFSTTNHPPGITNVSQRIYLSPDPYPGGDTFLGTVVFNGVANPYTFLERNATFRLPSVPGDYWIVVEADGSNDVAEVSEANNFAVTATPLHVDPAYTVTVTAGVESALAGTPVLLSGAAHKFGSAQPAPFEIVSLHIGLRGTERVIAALTDANGNYATMFIPLPGEAGTYTVGAAHPGITNALPTQDTFTLLGLKANPATLAVTVPALTTVTQEVSLANLGDVPLTGLTTSVIGLPAGFSASASVSPSIGAFGDGFLSLVLGVTVDTNDTRSFTVRATSAEGAIADVIVTVTGESLRPRLVTLPGALTAGVVPGAQRFLEFTVVNQGGAPSGTLTIQPPVFPFLHLVSPPALPPLGVGESNVVSLQLAPAPGQPLGLYTGDLLVSDGTANTTIPCSFRVVSTNTGTLLIEVTDQFTYYAAGAPRVAGAAVQLKDPYTGILLTNKLSDTGGLAVFTNLTEGYYTIEVTADEHDPFQTTLFVAAGDTTYQEALLNRQTVQFLWSVVPTEIGDRTKITIEAVFETVVPVPVLTVSPSVIDLADFPNGGTINLTITNHGLLAAQQTTLTFTEFDCWKITPLISDIGTLAARSSITIPVAICKDPTCTKSFNSCPAGGGLAARPASPADQLKVMQMLQRVGNTAAHGGSGGCGGGSVTFNIPCGLGSVGGGAPVGVSNGGGGGCGGIGSGGGGGGSGSGSIQVHGGPGGGNCNPCGLKIAGALAGCAINYLVPLPDIISCMKNSYQCYNQPTAAACLSAILSCLKAAGKEVPFAGDILDILDCMNSLLTACGGPGLGGFRPELAKDSGGKYSARFADRLPDYPYPGMAEVALGGAHAQAVLGVYTNIFGGQQWIAAASRTNFTYWLTLLSTSMDDGSASSNRIAAAERSVLLNHPLTNDLSVADINKFIDRWNRTLDYLDQGIYYSTNVPVGLSTDFIAFDIQHHLLELANEAIEEAAERGYSDVFVEMQDAVQQLRAFVFQPSGGICAQVRLKIDQEAVIARDAFRASLDIVNGSSSSLSNVTVDLLVMDAAGHLVNSLFAIPAPALTSIANITGTGEVIPGNTGKVTWTIIPTTETATNNPVVYYVGGSIRYTQNGAATVVPLAAQAITVYPIAQLSLTYFHQRDVLGDDPFTDITEPSVPYSLAVLVHNTGFGTARNLRITSAQPQIVDNKKGLFIDFQIIATEVAGQNLVPSLTANFGDILPGQVKLGRWLLKSTLQGLFVDYSATFEHLDGLGDPRASIIQSVDIRELIRVVYAPGVFQDNLPDMLVNDFPDLEDLPDKLYLSDGSVQPVSLVTTGSITGVLSSGNLQVTVNAALRAGWSYLRLPDPGHGQYRLKQVIRSDNVPLSFGTNAWTTDRTFIGGGKKPILENNLHLLDYNSPGSYTLVYELPPTPDTTAPASAVSTLPATSFPQIPLTWTGNDAGGSGIANYTIYVSDNGGSYAPWLANTTLLGAVYPGVLGHTYAFYSVAVDTSGNAEAPPVAPDASTIVSRSNTPPVLTVGTNRTVVEGATVLINNSASDAESDVQTLAFSLTPASPPNASINAASGLVTWPTGEGNGPSTNVLGVIVTDSGSPALSATGFVTVVVSEANQPPVVANAGPFTINEGALFSHSFTATDIDLPTNTIKWSLSGNVPAGAAINTNSGVFTWTPTTLQGPSTNTFTVVATDNGQPPLAGNLPVTIIVRDSLGDFVLAVGRTNVFRGESNTVPLTLAAGSDVTSVSFTLTTDDARLDQLALHSLSLLAPNSFLVPAGSNRVAISFGALPGQTLPVGTPLAGFGFHTLSNAGSAFVALQPLELLGEHVSGASLTNGRGQPGRVVVVGDAPLLEALNLPPRQLLLWGIPGQTYRTEFVPSLESLWQPWQTNTPVAPMTALPAHTNLSPVFYRAIRTTP